MVNKLTIEEMYYNIFQHFFKYTVIICLMLKVESFFLRIRNKTRMYTLTTSIQHSIESPS